MQPANTGTHRANIYARVSLPEGVAVSELGDNGNWVEAPILREGCRDHLERVRVRLKAVLLHALQGLCILCEEPRDVDLGRAAAADERTRCGERLDERIA